MARRQILLSLSKLGYGPLPSSPTQFPFFYVTGRLAKKLERMQGLFFSNIFNDVTVVRL